MNIRIACLRLLAFGLLACSSFVVTAQAAGSSDKPSDAEIQRLMKATRVEQTLQAMWPQIEAMQKKMVTDAAAGKALSPAQRAKLDDAMRRSNAIVRREMSWEAMQPVYIEVYRNTFDRSDIAGMLEFYESPAGQRLLDKMPTLMQNTMAAMQSRLMPMLDKLQAEFQASLQEPAR